MKRFRILGAAVAGMLLLGLVLLVWRPLKLYRLRTSYSIPENAVGAEAPQRSDGTFDFTEILNEVLSGNLASEDNAAVPLLRLVPPEDPQLELRKQSMQAIGEEWDRVQLVEFVDVMTFRHDIEASQGKQRTGSLRLAIGLTDLSEADREIVQRWMVQHPEVLETLVEASRKPAIFLPFVNWESDRPLRELRLDLRDLGYRMMNCLCLASVVECDRGNPTASADHLVTAHRLWRHFVSLPELHAQHGQDIARDEQLAAAGRHLFRSGQLSLEDCERLLTSLNDLPEMQSLESIFDTYLRFAVIDQAIGREIMQLDGHLPQDPFAFVSAGTFVVARRPHTLDQLIAQFREVKRYPTSEEANRLLAEITKLFDDGSVLLRESKVWNLPKELKVEDMDFSSSLRVAIRHAVDWPQMMWIRRAVVEQHLDQLRLGLLIERYRHQNGQLPEQLEELGDSFHSLSIARAFQQGDFEYRRDGDTFGFYNSFPTESGASETKMIFPTGRNAPGQ